MDELALKTVYFPSQSLSSGLDASQSAIEEKPEKPAAFRWAERGRAKTGLETGAYCGKWCKLV